MLVWYWTVTIFVLRTKFLSWYTEGLIIQIVIRNGPQTLLALGIDLQRRGKTGSPWFPSWAVYSKNNTDNMKLPWGSWKGIRCFHLYSHDCEISECRMQKKYARNDFHCKLKTTTKQERKTTVLHPKKSVWQIPLSFEFYLSNYGFAPWEVMCFTTSMCMKWE